MDAGVVACDVSSVIHADHGRVGVAVVRYGLAETAGCGPCKSDVTGHIISVNGRYS